MSLQSISAMTSRKEYHFCVLGSSTVGKTSLCERLIGKTFSRKSNYKQSLDDVATKYSIEVVTSDGLILYHFYDWAWEEKRKNESINQQLMRGFDGSLFVYDVNLRQSKGDFIEFMDWYQRAAGYDKPCLIIGNKNDSKKKAVQDGEGQALACKGDKRAFVNISLVDDTGINELILILSKLVLSDPNLSMSSFKIASAESLAWSDEKALLKIANIGLSSAISVKSKLVILVAMNSSVIEKFTEIFNGSEFSLDSVANADACEEYLKELPSDALPLVGIVAPPTVSETQRTKLKSLAISNNIEFIISIPKNAVTALTTALNLK